MLKVIRPVGNGRKAAVPSDYPAMRDPSAVFRFETRPDRGHSAAGYAGTMSMPRTSITSDRETELIAVVLRDDGHVRRCTLATVRTSAIPAFTRSNSSRASS